MTRRINGDEQRSAVRLVLRTLGTFEGSSETANGERLGRFGPGKPLSLLVYLAHSPNRGAPRDHLVELLWGDVDTDAARHALRQTIWYVRRVLGSGVLETDGDVVRLSAWCDSDAHDFIRAIDEHDEDKALALYTGDFLPAVAIPGGAEFERWADLERLRLRSVFTRTAEARVLHYLGRGEARLALPLARRARDADPADERLWRRLLEVHLAAHDVVGAAADADALENQWRADEREPEAATRALMRRARHPTAADEQSEATATVVAALVGRVSEFSALTAAWDEVQRGGRARHLHIAAPAGLGKTRLLSDFRLRLRASRSRVVLLRANPGERSVPYALVSSCAQALAVLPGAAAIAPGAANVLVQLNPALSSHFPEARGTPEVSDPLHHRTVAVRELAAAVSDERPVALLVDDLHWADRESLAVLSACAGDFREARIFLVTSARGSARQWFAHNPNELSLHPLDVRAIAELVASLGQLPDEPWADPLPALLHGASGGSPLIVGELLQLASDRDLLVTDGGHWHCHDVDGLLAMLASSDPMQQRIGRLDSLSRELLTLLSATGVPCPTKTLALATGTSVDVTAASLQSLEVGAMVQRVDDQWVPAHDEIAAALLAMLGTPATARARLSVARAVASNPSADLAALRLSAELLVDSGQSGELAELLARFASLREAGGVHGNSDEHLRALLGEALPPERRRRLLRAASWRSRVRLGVVVIIAMAALAAGALAWRRSHAPEVTLVLLGISSDSSVVSSRAIALRTDDPLPDVIELSREAVPQLPKGLANAVTEMSAATDGSGWYTHHAFADSGGQELVFIGRNGEERRLTNAMGDDGDPRPSPDNGSLYFTTSRFSPLMHSSIARLDLASGRVSEITSGLSVQGRAIPSPDGSRIAFSEHDFDTGRVQMCVADADGTHRRCTAAADHAVSWRDERHLWALARPGNDSLLDVGVEGLQVGLVCPTVRDAQFSPAGRWAVMYGERAGFDGSVYWLARASSPCEGPVLLVHGRPARQAVAAWDVHVPVRDFVDQLRIVRSPEVQSFSPVQLFAEGRTPAGAPRGIGAVRWRSLDTMVAMVTEDGLLIPRGAGTVRVIASAGGFRADTARLPVRDEPAHLLERSTWDGPRGLAPWYVFGEPAPFIDSTGGRPFFSINGDSTYPNGLRLRRTVDARQGLVVRARVKYRVLETQWQYLHLGIGAPPPDSSWDRWDKRTGAPPAAPRSFAHCEFGYPANEGTAGLAEVYVGESGAFRTYPAPRAIQDGAWVWEEVQILPDGRCGVAADGRPLALGRARQPVTMPMEVRLLGQSHRTQMLVDTIEVYAGVLHPDWWLTLDLKRRAADSTPPPQRPVRPVRPRDSLSAPAPPAPE